MKIKKRAALGVAALAVAATAAAPAPEASAYEYCLAAAFENQPEICFGGSECNELNKRLEAVQEKTGIRFYCLQ